MKPTLFQSHLVPNFSLLAAHTCFEAGESLVSFFTYWALKYVIELDNQQLVTFLKQKYRVSKTVQVLCAYEQSKTTSPSLCNKKSSNACFDQYQASSAVLEWPRDALCVWTIKKPQYMLPHTLDFLAVMRPHCAPTQLNPLIVFLTPMTLMP